MTGEAAFNGVFEGLPGEVTVEDEGVAPGMGAGGDEGVMETGPPEEDKGKLHVFGRSTAQSSAAEGLAEDFDIRQFVSGNITKRAADESSDESACEQGGPEE